MCEKRWTRVLIARLLFDGVERAPCRAIAPCFISMPNWIQSIKRLAITNCQDCFSKASVWTIFLIGCVSSGDGRAQTAFALIWDCIKANRKHIVSISRAIYLASPSIRFYIVVLIARSFAQSMSTPSRVSIVFIAYAFFMERCDLITDAKRLRNGLRIGAPMQANKYPWRTASPLHTWTNLRLYLICDNVRHLISLYFIR